MMRTKGREVLSDLILPDNTAAGTDGETVKAISSNAFYDHNATDTGVHGVGASTIATAATLATHAALRTGVHGIVLVRLAADHTLDSNSTTLQNVTGLVFALAANEIWRVELLLILDSSGVADGKFKITLPAGATADGRLNYTTADGASGTAGWAEGDTTTLFGAGAGTPYCPLVLTCEVTVGGTAGNFQVQAAQNTAEVSTSKILANSYIIATRLA